MKMMENNLEVNSKEYWNYRFQHDWELNMGREQTKFFANLALNHLPEWIKADIKNNKLSICDAGCADGDAVPLFLKEFPDSKIIGVDFSEEAIQRAKKYYPEHQFVCSSIENLDENFDVIFSSNVLEHFENPFTVLEAMLEKVKKHVILLLPFQEYDRIIEHFFTFDYNSFPLKIKEFIATHFTEINGAEIPNTLWAKKQILIIYSKLNNTKLEEIDLSTFGTNIRTLESNMQMIKDDLDNKKLANELLTKKIIDLEKQLKIYEEKFHQKELELIHSREELEKSKRSNEELEAILNSRINELEKQLELIQTSFSWKILVRLQYFYKYRVIRYPYIFLKTWRKEGIAKAIQLSFNKLFHGSKKNKSEPSMDFFKILNSIRSEDYTGVAIVPSGFEFDELYNQRTINLAKYLGEQNFLVFYVPWQWSKDEEMKLSYQEVYKNVYQIPMYDFLSGANQLTVFKDIKDKFMFITIPSKHFYDVIFPLKKQGFSIIYDIMDDWEEFSKVSQAPWYDKIIEEAVVVNSDAIFAVSDSLVKKFLHLRSDIEINGNGLNMSLLGNYPNISRKVESEDKKIHIGYFGHLTESWFNWELIFELLEKNPNITLHVIGYGESDFIRKRIFERKNIIYYGKVSPSDLYKYVQKWHLGIIPFKSTKLSEGVDPIKIYEYLYFGLPTIVTGIPHLSNYPYVFYSSDDINDLNEKILKQYNKVIYDGTEYEKIEEFLSNCYWEKRFEDLIAKSKEYNLTFQLYREG
jgi:O-antigen biosynthesis protein